MSNPNPATTTPAGPARTHSEAGELLRRPFAPGAIGFRAMTKATFGGVQYGGAQAAAFLNAQSVVQRLNHVVPGRWRQQFTPVPTDHLPANTKRLYLACRLTITLPTEPGGPDVDAIYEDIGEMDSGSFAGLKALYSDARKRAGVAAGIGAYLYTALTPVVLALGPGDHQVQSIRRGQGKSDLLVLSAATEQWLRQGYEARMNTDAVKRDLGPILAHGEPEIGMGQGDAAEADHAAAEAPGNETPSGAPAPSGAKGNGVVAVDFGGLGPAAHEDRCAQPARRPRGGGRLPTQPAHPHRTDDPDLLPERRPAPIDQITDAVHALAQAG